MIERFRRDLKGISAFFRLLRQGRLGDLERILERGKAVGLFQIDRFDEAGKLYDRGEPFHNIFVNAGMVAVWNLVTGQGSTTFSNANASLGTGDSSTATTVVMTDLQAASNKLRVAMNASFPNAPVNGLEQWQADFTGANGNYSWQEFAVFNTTAQSGGTMLDRAISNQGTKTSGQTWRLTFSFTLS